MGNGRMAVVGMLFLASLFDLLASARIALQGEADELSVRIYFRPFR
jgi:hypothetical protein